MGIDGLLYALVTAEMSKLQNGLSTVSGVAVVLLLLFGTAHADSIAFDNGSFSGPQVGRTNSHAFGPMVEDFAIAGNATITRFDWQQNDSTDVVYLNTTLTIWDALPASLGGGAANVIYSGDLVATRSATANTVVGIPGYDYSVSGLNIAVTGGTYYLGIATNVSAGFATWAQTTGTSQTIDGRWQQLTGFWANEDSSFQVYVADDAPVPEPGSLALMGLGGLGLLWYRRRRKPV